jgi:ssDNA-binding Zn-finger/Zn-ribbon topoisomerase 1
MTEEQIIKRYQESSKMKYFYGCELCNNVYESSKKIEEIEQQTGKPVTCYSCGGPLKQVRGA